MGKVVQVPYTNAKEVDEGLLIRISAKFYLLVENPPPTPTISDEDYKCSQCGNPLPPDNEECEQCPFCYEERQKNATP